MPISSGTHTVGAPGSGATYATWQAAFADLIDGSLTGDLELRQIAPTTETGKAIFPTNFSTVSPLWTLSLTTDVPHRGNFNNVSRLVSIAHSDHCLDLSAQANGVTNTIVVNGLYFRRTVAAATNDKAAIFAVTSWANTDIQNQAVNCLYDGNGNGGTGFSYDNTADLSANDFSWYHCVAIDAHTGFIPDSKKSGFAMSRCWASGCTVGFDFTRNTIEGTQASDVVRCVAFNNTTDYANPKTGMKFRVGMSSDATLGTPAQWHSGSTDLLPNLNPTTHFLSASESSTFFMYPRPLSQYYDVGTAAGFQKPRDIIGKLNNAAIWDITSGAGGGFVTHRSAGPVAAGSEFTVQTDLDENLVTSSLVMAVTAQNDMELSQDPQVLRRVPAVVANNVGMSQDPSVKQTAKLTVDDDVTFVTGASIIEPPSCELDTTNVRTGVNFWFPLDTLANQLSLPKPQEGDVNEVATRVTPRNVRGGDLRVYKAGPVIFRLEMSFVVDRPKRNEAIDFFSLSTSKEVRLLDWEDRLWRGVIINTPIDFVHQGKTTQSENYAFDLVFEAVERLN
jgi:hypothetical protein